MIERIGDYIYEVAHLEDGGVAKSIQGCAIKLVISGQSSVEVNNNLPLEISYRDWQGNLLEDETHPITVNVGEQNLILIPGNGKAEFDFVSEIPGRFGLRASAEFTCDRAEMEVIVNE